jgi:hypothetical protein
MGNYYNVHENTHTHRITSITTKEPYIKPHDGTVQFLNLFSKFQIIEFFRISIILYPTLKNKREKYFLLGSSKWHLRENNPYKFFQSNKIVTNYFEYINFPQEIPKLFYINFSCT